MESLDRSVDQQKLLAHLKQLVAATGLAILVASSVYVLFVLVPMWTGFSWWIGLLLVYGGVAGAIGGWGYAAPSAPTVATVDVTGEIKRTDSPVSFKASADDIVAAIEEADEDGAEALLVTCNSPGGAVVPSEDLRRAIEEFDGPTVAHAVDKCASGAYLAACGADHVVARRGGLVGSIGVVGSTVNVADLADQLGVSYERLAAGDYKDAGTPLRELEEDERSYLQSIIDDYYGQFVKRVATARDLDEETVRETEARVFTGDRAVDLGLVDETGDRETAEAYLQDQLELTEPLSESPATIDDVTPSSPLSAVTRPVVAAAGSLAARAAYGFGAAVADRIDADLSNVSDGFRFRY